MASKYWSKPIDAPHPEVMLKPIWSTWALYKKDINEAKVVVRLINIRWRDSSYDVFTFMVKMPARYLFFTSYGSAWGIMIGQYQWSTS